MGVQDAHALSAIFCFVYGETVFLKKLRQQPARRCAVVDNQDVFPASNKVLVYIDNAHQKLQLQLMDNSPSINLPVSGPRALPGNLFPE